MTVFLWLAAILLWRSLLTLLVGGEESQAGPESVEQAAAWLFFASPLLVPLVLAWIVCVFRAWRWGIIGLPPALAFLGLYGSILIQYLNASVFA